jgi:hypothetical protein
MTGCVEVSAPPHLDSDLDEVGAGRFFGGLLSPRAAARRESVRYRRTRALNIGAAVGRRCPRCLRAVLSRCTCTSTTTLAAALTGETDGTQAGLRSCHYMYPSPLLWRGYRASTRAVACPSGTATVTGSAGQRGQGRGVSRPATQLSCSCIRRRPRPCVRLVACVHPLSAHHSPPAGAVQQCVGNEQLWGSSRRR